MSPTVTLCDDILSKKAALDWREEKEEKGEEEGSLIFCPMLLYAGNVGKPLLFNSILKHNITITEDKIDWFLIFNFFVYIDFILSYL